MQKREGPGRPKLYIQWNVVVKLASMAEEENDIGRRHVVLLGLLVPSVCEIRVFAGGSGDCR